MTNTSKCICFPFYAQIDNNPYSICNYTRKSWVTAVMYAFWYGFIPLDYHYVGLTQHETWQWIVFAWFMICLVGSLYSIITAGHVGEIALGVIQFGFVLFIWWEIALLIFISNDYNDGHGFSLAY